MTKRRRLTDDERRLWQRFTADIEQLAKDKPPVEPKLPSKNPGNQASASNGRSPAGSQTRPAPPKPASMSPTLDPTKPVNTDRRTWERLKRGHIAIESRLDLHGRTQIEAHDALDRFLAASSASGMRCVLIVTGKGVDGHGVLRQMVPRWLAEGGNRKKIITYCTAQPRHGGEGALYVLIRRGRAHNDR